MPPSIAPTTARSGERSYRRQTVVDGDPTSDYEATGTMFIQDIYQGMTGIERGQVKYVRVMGNLEWPWDQTGM